MSDKSEEGRGETGEKKKEVPSVRQGGVDAWEGWEECGVLDVYIQFW